MSGTGRPSRLLVYVAGPYAANDLDGVRENARRAMHVARLVARAHRGGFGIEADLRHGRLGSGYAPVVPHALGWCGLYGDPFDDGEPSPARQAALEMGIDLLERCEVLVVIEGSSYGVKTELRHAAARNLDTFRTSWEEWLTLGAEQSGSGRGGLIVPLGTTAGTGLTAKDT